VQNTVTHELGHALGLAHVMDHPEAVMFPMAFDGDVDKRTLSSDDLAGLTALYPQGLAAGAGPQLGCSVSGAPSWLAALLALAAVARVRRVHATVRSVRR
jgi:MYXO-CTERM domain-containing protein